MSAPLFLLVASLTASPQATAEPTPPKLIRIFPGDSGVYVDFERRAEDVERRVRYCVYMAETPGGPYEQVARFWAGLYKGNFGHTNGYIGHLTNGKPYYFVVTVQSDGRESAYSNEVAGTPVENKAMAVPYIDGVWWRICENAPNVAPYNNHPKHNACDFSIWQDDHGKWHCVSCIRSTTYPSQTRLLYHWQTDEITDIDWSQDKRIFWTSGTEGEPDVLGRRLEDGPYTLERGMQAPHCFKVGDRYYFFHNNAGCFCLSSPDGDDETFRMQSHYDGELKFFDMGRDVGFLDNRARDGYWYTLLYIQQFCAQWKTGRGCSPCQGHPRPMERSTSLPNQRILRESVRPVSRRPILHFPAVRGVGIRRSAELRQHVPDRADG